MEKNRCHSNDQFDAHLPVFDVFERSLISTLWDRLYSLSHKVELSEHSKNAKNVQLSINMLI